MISKLYWKIVYFIIGKHNDWLRKRSKGLYYDRLVKGYRHTKLDKCEYGDILYIMCELSRDGLYYEYSINGEQNHAHSFEEVLLASYENGSKFNIEDKEQFSRQELILIDKVRELNN